MKEDLNMAWKTYKEKIKIFSDRIVAAQSEIRILDAIKWDDGIREDFFKHKAKRLPAVDEQYYQTLFLGYNPKEKIEKFKEIKTDLLRDLGSDDEIAQLMAKVCEEYMLVCEMLQFRGTPRFAEISCQLYGSPRDFFYDDKVSVIHLGQMLYSILHKTPNLGDPRQFERNIPAPEAVKTLQNRFSHYFGPDEVVVTLSDGIIADASAGGTYVKLRENAMFSERDIDVLEVHEGWVHVGTSRNGALQTAATWLSKGPPRVATTQEGLAQMLEIFTFRSFPARAKRVNDRVLGIDKALEGADFLETYNYFLTEGYSDQESFNNAQRVYRGGVVTGGHPFTKDIAYCKGFVQIYNFLRSSIALSKSEIIPFLFAGKLNVEDVFLLYRKYHEGVIDYPKYVPRIFKDLNGLVVWMGYSNFFNVLNLKKIREHYDALFRAA